MVVVMVMMMMRLRKCGSRNHQDHGKKQSLFHVQHHNNKGAARMPLRVTFGLHHNPNGVTPAVRRNLRARSPRPCPCAGCGKRRPG
jgi:hypothetical protein